MSWRTLLIAGLLCLTATGCITMGRSTEGNPIEWDAVEQLKPGSHTMRETLELLGAPLEYHRHPDGTLLVYRHREYDYLRVGIEPDVPLRFIALDRAASSVLENLRLVVENGSEFESRVAAYFDRDGVLAAVGTNRRETR